MTRYILYRLAFFVPLIMALAVLLFVAVRLLPGDPVSAMLGSSSSPARIAELRHQLGLDRSIPAQFVTWLRGAVHGDLGLTASSQQPISDLLVHRVPASFELMGGALAVILVTSLPAGFLAGARPGGRVDRFVSALTLVGLGIPTFYLGFLCVLLFAVTLTFLPSQGYVPFSEDPRENLRFLILPAVTLGFSLAPYLTRMTRATVAQVTKEPYVRAAEARGLGRWLIFRRYIVRNAIPNLVMIYGLMLGSLVSGSIFVEALYNWPGMGRLIVDGVLERDYLVIQAMILLYAVIFATLTLICEIVQAALDPRVRLR
jgi:peptide/nickel transport system permease protein